MKHAGRFGSLAAALCLLAACGGGTAREDSANATRDVPAASDPHPCDLLSAEEASGVLGVPINDVSRLEADPLNGGQASCAWEGGGAGPLLGLIVEGPSFFAGAPDGYRDSAEAYQYWRDDTLDAGFSVIDVEGAGDAAFMPVFGADPPNTLVMRRGEFLVHLSLSGFAGERPMTEAARLVAAALDLRPAPDPAGS